MLPALREDAVTPDGSRFEPAGTGGFLPSPTPPQTIPQTPSADCLHPETADSDLDRIPPPQRSSGGFGQAAATERPVIRLAHLS